MAPKRKAIAEAARRQLKRIQITASSEGYDGHESEPESPSSYCLSEQGNSEQNYQHTPITPFSPASSCKYPSDLKTHLCPYENCRKAFNRPARLTEHIRSHNNERIFNCTYDECDKTFLRQSHLNHHIKSAHTLIRDYVCDREGCGKTFVTGSRLRRHLAAHEGRDKYRCTEHPPCNETFRKHSTLQKHIMTVHLHKRPFPCPHNDPTTNEQCTQAFDTAGHLRAHERRLHGGSRFTCTECMSPGPNEGDSSTLGNDSSAASFSTYALLQSHMRSVHPPVCPNCAITCSSARELRRHLDIAHGNMSLEERKLHPCHFPACGRSFTKKGNLNVHIKTVHDGEKRFACGETDLTNSNKIEGWTGDDACGKRYGSKLALEEHVRTVHLGFKNVKAERRAQLASLNGESTTKQSTATPSNIALLTGEGYVEESGRHIPCLLEDCPHYFRRDYDLWVHMGSRHGLESNDIQILFMQRAMQGGDHSFDLELSGIQSNNGHVPEASNNDVTMLHDPVMQGVLEGTGDESMITNDSRNYEAGEQLSLIDPLLTYTMDQSF